MNFFENAKFGDKFKTRDGRMAIFISQKDCAAIIIEGEEYFRSYYLSGKSIWKCSDFDIVSRWVEPIDHSKLHDMAEKYLKENYPCCDINIHPHIRCSYKDGYIQAKQE